MENPLAQLKTIVKDPVELTSITFPSAALVVVLFAYRETIHPALADVPDPLSGDVYGGLLFLVVTLVVSLALRRVSHDLLNWLYDRFYRDRRRAVEDSWYTRTHSAGRTAKDPLRNEYAEALESLRRAESPVISRVELLQTHSKLARSISLILFIFAAVAGFSGNPVLMVVCAALSGFMLYAFFKDRWEASELVYQATHSASSEG